MKFRKKECYLTNSRKGCKELDHTYKIEMMVPDELNTVYQFKIENRDKYVHDILGRVKKPNKIYDEFGIKVEPTLHELNDLIVMKSNSDYRLRKPAEYVYTIINYKLCKWKCYSIEYSYSLSFIVGKYKLQSIQQFDSDTENLYRFVHGYIDELELTDEEFNQWKKEVCNKGFWVNIGSGIMESAIKM